LTDLRIPFLLVSTVKPSDDMQFEDFFDILDNKRMLKNDFRQQIRDLLMIRYFEKGDLWQREQNPAMEIPFLHKGTAVGFRPLDGKRQVCNLWEQGEIIICGNNIFGENKDKAIYVQFLEPSSTYVLNTLDIIKLCNRHGDARFMVQYFLAEALKKMEDQNYRLSCLPPEKRLEEVSIRYSNAFGKLSQIEKASFLGISRQTLYNIS
jgi:signal-transduction protein with cAMP-binding, CBS, and nucleotidyltransferase domain